MKTKIEVNREILEKSIELIDFVGKKSIDDLILDFLLNKIYISDILFFLLQKLSNDDKIVSSLNIIEKNEYLDENYKKELIEYLENKISKLSRKLFFTPLEISKFYQCPRRFFLEKFVHSQQKKTERSFEGEVFHKSIREFVKNYNKYTHNLEVLSSMISENVLKEYQGKVEMKKEQILETLYAIDNFIKREKFKYLIPEPLLISIKYGLVGSPDLIGVTQNNEVIPIEIKTGTKRIKRGLKIQLAGEALVIEASLRREVNKVILLSLNNRKIFRIRITEEDKKLVQNLLSRMKKTLFIKRIPPMSSLPNFRKVVCPYCHVREVCDFIEDVTKTLKSEFQKQEKL